MSGQDVLIIGAGIVGICAAVNLAEAGLRVTVIDRTGICEETSSGNAGALAFSDMLPLVQKGVFANLPRWLADPLGPLAIRPSYLPRLAPWLYRFWRASHPDRFEASLTAQASLMEVARAEWLTLLDRSGTRSMLREDGALELYESEAEFRTSLPGWDARGRFGVEFRHIEGDEIAAYQPGLSPQFVKATFVPDWKTVADPKLLGKAVWAYAEQAWVTAIENRGPKNLVWLKGAEKRYYTTVVIAAGAWSNILTAARLGDAIPLETERGYNTTLPRDAFDVKRQLIIPGHGFVITPMETGLRIGGAVEFGGLKLPPNYQRSKAMLEKAKRFLPGIRTEGGQEWMGYRPSLPDSLPVIGRSTASANIIYAFGHGHLGLTQAAATGRFVRDLVTGRTPPLDLSPFSPQRF
jgi:D-amino-acid dehydrogenase